MIEVIDEYLHSKIRLHIIPKIYILDNLENDLQYIYQTIIVNTYLVKSYERYIYLFIRKII